MKFLSVVVLFAALNAFADPCGGGPVGFWTNPDGSRGGSVGKDAKVQAGAVIALGAEVCEFAQVKTGAQILGQARVGGRAVINAGSIIDGRAKVQGEAKIGGSGSTTKVAGDATVEGSAVITGTSHVYARAKVGGGAKVHNSIICQASVIEGITVTDSDYYCQTEDPEPPHPGELGKATLLGVDVDRDGVRDDVEIWINDRFSNTPTKDMYNYRMAFKQYASANLKMLRSIRDRTVILKLVKESFDALDCIESFHITEKKDLKSELKQVEEVNDLRKDVAIQMLNTRDRIKADSKIDEMMHGEGLGGTNTKTPCAFKVK